MLRAMPSRSLLVAPVLALLACGEPAPPPAAPVTPASATPPPVMAPAPTASATTALLPTTPAACPPGEWHPPTTLTGKATRASGQNAKMESEKYIALELATPVCGPSGQKIARVQLIPMGTTYAALAKLEGKSITVVGTASTAMTAHHHEDVVFDVQKVE